MHFTLLKLASVDAFEIQTNKFHILLLTLCKT